MRNALPIDAPTRVEVLTWHVSWQISSLDHRLSHLLRETLEYVGSISKLYLASRMVEERRAERHDRTGG